MEKVVSIESRLRPSGEPVLFLVLDGSFAVRGVREGDRLVLNLTTPPEEGEIVVARDARGSVVAGYYRPGRDGVRLTTDYPEKARLMTGEEFEEGLVGVAEAKIPAGAGLKEPPPIEPI